MTTTCPTCKSTLDTEGRFCPDCGQDVQSASLSSPAQATPNIDGKRSKGLFIGIGAALGVFIVVYAFVIAPANKRKAAEEDFVRFSQSHGMREDVARSLYKKLDDLDRGRSSYSANTAPVESESQIRERRKRESAAELKDIAARVNELAPKLLVAKEAWEAADTTDEKLQVSKRFLEVLRTSLELSRSGIRIAESNIRDGINTASEMDEMLTATKSAERALLGLIEKVEKELAESNSVSPQA